MNKSKINLDTGLQEIEKIVFILSIGVLLGSFQWR